MCRNIINTRFSRRRFLASALAAASTPVRAPAAAPPGADDVARGFQDVPNSSRMRMHWYIFGPAWTAPEAERELRRMKQAHIGGVLLFPTYPIALDDAAHDIRNDRYLSEEFLSVLHSAAGAARHLGMTVDTVLGTGWPYGGPSVSLDDSAHAIRTVRVPGARMQETAPLKPGEKMVAAFAVEGGQYRRLATGETYTGEVQLFYATPTRMQVKRAALGAEGLIVDHYSPQALADFLRSVGDTLLHGAGPGAIRSIFSDSLEVYRATWTERLPRIFEERRGYDLVPHLPALFFPDEPGCFDVRRDFWGVLSELAGEAYVRPLEQWAHAQGVTTQVEAYGTPPVNLSSYRYVDIPVGEHYEWKEFSSSRWASSGGHLAGKPVILAEAWTWVGLPNRFGDTLEQLKLCSDLHFLSGINALYGLTYAYSPEQLGSPGWVPYFGPAMNHTAPAWPYFRYLVDYVNRASYILQQGKPVADIAVYLPAEDAMANAAPEQLLLNWAVRDRLSSNGPPPEFSLKNALHYESDVVKNIATTGRSFDGIDTFTCDAAMRVEGGRLRSGDGDYGVVVLPNLMGMDVEPLEKLASFVRGGGTVIATQRLPDRCWGLNDGRERSARVQEIVTRLFGLSPGRHGYHENPFGSGVAIFCEDEQGSFRKALHRSPPDIQFREPSEHVSFVHRRSADRDFYFIANTSEQHQTLDATFRAGHRAPELWDPHTGEIAEIAVFEYTGAGPRLAFDLAPLESKVFVFRQTSREPAATHTNLPLLAAGGAKVFANGRYFLESGGARRDIAVEGIPAPVLLSPQWQLSLEDRHLRLDELRSWTEIPEARWFSGRGVYEADFEAPAFPGLGVILDLGQVRETAEVHLNGRTAGVAWMRPYRLDITASLQAGSNHIRIDVTNLLINKILGMGPTDYSKVYAKYGERFPPGEEWDVIRDPLPSGLLGPVRLVFYKLVKP